MAFHGLFIGVDKFQSNEINELRCSARDARALYALFCDTVSGQSKLLVNHEATLQAIIEELQIFQQCSEENVVFIFFSGHGSETHELVTYDAQLNDLESTSLPLSDLTQLFSAIPAKQVICFLDCCFSGAMGAKVLHVDLKKKGLTSVDQILNELSGEGRLIFTASSASQAAWESSSLNHGIFTHYILEAILGADEVIDNGKVALYKFLDYVTRKVIAKAELLGKVQSPTVRGVFDKAFRWPIFIMGDVFKSFFPTLCNVRISSAVKDLSLLNYPAEIVACIEKQIPHLNDMQLSAINDYGVLNYENLVVSAATSSGKTLIGELAAIKNIVDGKRSIFLLPLKALVNDKHRQMSSTYGSFGLRIIQATSDSVDDIPALIRGKYDLCLMTYEKFTSLLLTYPHILEQVGVVVIDEVQMITDKSRGINLEFIMTLLRTKKRHGISPQLIALSAVIGSTNEFENWLDARLLKRDERPVPLDEGLVSSNGCFRFIESDTKKERRVPNYIEREFRKNSSQDLIIPLVRKLVSEGKQVIVFRETKGEARGAANYLSENLSLSPATDVLDALPAGDPSVISNALRKCLRGGVAFHTADLDREERAVIELFFRANQSSLRVIAATTTLAMGINTPAEAVIVAGLEHPGKPPVPYSIAEYKNIIGRAGRLGYASRGTSYLIALSQRDENELWNKYVLGKTENLTSRFLNEATDIRSLIIRVLSAARKTAGQGLVGMDAQEIVEFLEESYGSFQLKTNAPDWKWDYDRAMNDLISLESHNIIKKHENDKYRLTELGWFAGQGGIEVETVIRLVDAVSGIDFQAITDPTLIALTQVTCELSQILIPLNSKGINKELNTWRSELVNQGVDYGVLNFIERIADDTYQAAGMLKKTAACLLWISNLSLEEIENVLTKHGMRWNGAAGVVRSVVQRTCDLLNMVVKTVEILNSGIDLSDRAFNLLIRLETGTSIEVFEIAKALGNRLSRADYRTLVQHNILCFDSIRGMDEQLLLFYLDNNIEKVKWILAELALHDKRDKKSEMIPPLIPAYEG